jgi:predicted nucleotidyltransferase component of viral defense system
VGAREIEVPCYDLREMLLEKLRGISGQRRFAIARDLYDIQQLLQRMDVRIEDVSPHARKKFAATEIVLSPTTLNGLHARKDEFETDWARNVVRLTPASVNADFEAAWATAIRAVSTLLDRGEG